MEPRESLLSADALARHRAWNEGRDAGGRLVVEGADLRDAPLPRSTGPLDLTRARFVRCNFSGLSLAGASLSAAELVDCNFHGADLSGAHLTEARIHRCDFTGAKLLRANIALAEVRDSSFAGADLREAVLGKSEWHHADLTRATLTAAHLPRARFEDCDLRGATLDDAEAEGAELHRVDLRGAQIEGLRVNRTRFEGVAFDGVTGQPLVGEPGITGEVDLSAAADGSQVVPASQLQHAWLAVQRRIVTAFESRFREDQVPAHWTLDLVEHDLAGRVRETADDLAAKLDPAERREAHALLSAAAKDWTHPLLSRLLQATAVDWGAEKEWPAQRRVLELVADRLAATLTEERSR